MRLIGELIEMISRRAGLDNVREVGESLGRRRPPANRPPDKSPPDNRPDAPTGPRAKGLLDVLGSDLLDFGQLVIEGMKRTTGKGDPDTGARFAHAHTGFNRAGETLRSAVADDRWEGSGSRAYADQNTRQQLRSQGMADADLEVHRVLYREALQIAQRREVLDDQSNFLAYTSYATFPLQFIPRYGEAAKLAIELSALQGALGISARQLYQLHSEVSANATELQEAVGRYSNVADNAEIPGGGVDFTLVSATPADDASRGVSTSALAPVTGGGSASGCACPTTAPIMNSPAPAPTPVMPTAPATMSVPPPAAVPPAPAGAAAGGGALGSMLGSLAGLVTSAALAAAQRAADERARVEDVEPDEPEAGAHEGAEDSAKDRAKDEVNDGEQLAAGDGPERVPMVGAPDADGPQTPLTAKLNTDASPGPPAGTSPQDKK